MPETIYPNNVIAAVRHPDPYPYYQLCQEKALYYDDALKAWLAFSAEAVEAVLSHPACAVRPPSMPVPEHLHNTTAGIIFQNLIRMTDGKQQTKVKSSIKEQLKMLPFHQLVDLSDRRAKNRLQASDNLNQFAADLPVYVMADLIDMPPHQIDNIVRLVQTFALCLNPVNEANQVEKGTVAAKDLMQLLYDIDSVFIKQLAEKTSPEVAVANSIGLMFQSYEATAGLIGNALHTLAIYPELREQLISDDNLLRAFIEEVNRWNPSVQNTRRYLTMNSTIMGHDMSSEDTIILVLAAANRDEHVNANPHQFLLERDKRQSYTFGMGQHACIGETIALTIAQAGLKHILATGAGAAISELTTYQAYGNLRIPILVKKEEKK